MVVRNVLGSLLALIGAAAVVASPFRSWYGGRDGRYYRVADLFTGTGVTDVRSGLYVSLLAPFAAAALVALIGIVLRSRWAVAVAGLLVIGFSVLWMVRQGQALGYLTVNADDTGLGTGVAGALGGGVVLLLGALLMSGRARRLPRHGPEAGVRAPDDRDGPDGPDGPAGPGGYDEGSGAHDPYAQGDPYGQDDSYGQGGPYDDGRGGPPYGGGHGGPYDDGQGGPYQRPRNAYGPDDTPAYGRPAVRPVRPVRGLAWQRDPDGGGA